MCQQWIGSLGLVLDIIGFIVLAREWYWAINLQGAEKVEHWAGLDVDTKEEAKYRWQGWLQQHSLRRNLFRTGLGLIILGFVGQLVGALPASYVAIIGLKSCS
jgi:hypothetical protein